MNDEIGLSIRSILAALGRAVAAARRHLGWGDLAETRLSPAHGWLLPAPANRRPPLEPTQARGSSR